MALTWDRQVTLSTAAPGEAMTLMRRKKEESPGIHTVTFPPISLVRGRGLICWGVWTRGRKDVAAAALPSPHPGASLPWSHALAIPLRPHGAPGWDPGAGMGLSFSTLGVIPATAAPEAAPQPSFLGPWDVTDPHSQPLCLPSSGARAGLVTERLQMPMTLKNMTVAAFQGQAGLAGTPSSRRLS